MWKADVARELKYFDRSVTRTCGESFAVVVELAAVNMGIKTSLIKLSSASPVVDHILMLALHHSNWRCHDKYSSERRDEVS